jgi:probable HAF family extracellular repeat protein
VSENISTPAPLKRRTAWVALGLPALIVLALKEKRTVVGVDSVTVVAGVVVVAVGAVEVVNGAEGQELAAWQPERWAEAPGGTMPTNKEPIAPSAVPTAIRPSSTRIRQAEGRSSHQRRQGQSAQAATRAHSSGPWVVDSVVRELPAQVAADLVAPGNGQAIQLQVNGIPYGINNAGEIVGWAIGATPNVVGSDQFGFLVRNGQVIDLNTWSPPGWQITSAWEINENSEITGLGLFNGVAHGILLTPTDVQQAFVPDIRIPELYARILFGVTKDGGGLVFVGKHPVPIDPWGPLWGRLVRSHPDAIRALAIVGVAAGFDDPRTRADLQQAAPAVLQKATAGL